MCELIFTDMRDSFLPVVPSYHKKNGSTWRDKFRLHLRNQRLIQITFFDQMISW